jgi:uncharacterized repeat protein (TIGR01451 family)
MNPAQTSNSLRAERQFKKIGAQTSARKMLVRLSAFLILVCLAGALVYSSSQASSEKNERQSPQTPSQNSPINSVSPRTDNGLLERMNSNFVPNYSAAGTSLMPPFFVSGITIQENTCTTPQSTFNLNQVVCITVTGAEFIGQRVVVVDPQNLIRQVSTIAASPDVESYQIPDTTTTSLFGGFLNENNLGTWHVYVLTGRGGKLAAAAFDVKDPAHATSNVEIHTGRQGGDPITSGSTVTYNITLVNFGPDAAANVVLTNPTPSFTTFQTLTIPASPAGITCTDPGVGGVGNVICTIPSLPANSQVNFVVQYLVGSVGAGSSIQNTVSFTTDTTNISGVTSASDNGTTTSTGPPSGCDLTCPANIAVLADTTGPNPSDPSQTVPGAYVTFSTTTGGTCGTVTSIPASGSFFPLGTTPVTSSSSDGGGECSFTVTVGSPVSIACPANKVANADSNCSAIVSLGTPNTAGDGVTVTVTRSDGLPMYDCHPDPNDPNNPPAQICVRKSQDLPFSVGVTSVTWTASNSSGTISCTQTVTVYDVTPPTITATNSTASADANCQAAVPDYSSAAFDNCACNSSDTSQICDSRHDIAVTQDVAPGTLVGLGPHTIHLTANDGSISPGPDGIIGTPDDIQGNVSVKTITFTVVDTTPPSITAPGPVTAYTGAGATTCDTVVSDAVLGTPTTSDNCGPITVTRVPSGNTFPVGTTTVVWTATDGAGNHTSANQTVTVIDNTPPVITLNGQTPSMWPPNHKYHTFGVTSFVTSVTDNCDTISVGSVVITKVTSDELENGPGSGNTLNDIIIAADCKSVQLRSEREGGGDGRVYTIFFSVSDTSGNVGTASATVVVQHNPGEPAVDSGPHYTVCCHGGTCP